jgi:ribosomal protein S6
MTHYNEYYYEGMFVFPQARSASLAAAAQCVEEMINRSQGEIIAMSKWAERHLATPIEKNKRALFILCYFKMQGTRVVNLERDCNLSEMVRRYLIIRADHLTLEEMQNTDARDALRIEAALGDDSVSDKPLAVKDTDESDLDESVEEVESSAIE